MFVIDHELRHNWRWRRKESREEGERGNKSKRVTLPFLLLAARLEQAKGDHDRRGGEGRGGEHALAQHITFAPTAIFIMTLNAT